MLQCAGEPVQGSPERINGREQCSHIHPRLLGTGLELFGAHQCRKHLRDAFQGLGFCGLALFLPLDLLPIGEDLLGGLGHNAGKDMRMAANQLFADSVAHAVDIKYPFFAFHFRVEYDLKQHISQFFLQSFGIFLVDGFQYFIDLFHKVSADRMMVLLPIPWAALTAPQDLHDLTQILKTVALLLFKRYRHNAKPLSMSNFALAVGFSGLIHASAIPDASFRSGKSATLYILTDEKCFCKRISKKYLDFPAQISKLFLF